MGWAIRQLAQRHDPKAVAAWIMNWTPDKPVSGLRMETKMSINHDLKTVVSRGN